METYPALPPVNVSNTHTKTFHNKLNGHYLFHHSSPIVLLLPPVKVFDDKWEKHANIGS